MGDNYGTFLFSSIDPNTTSIEYFGYLDEDLFDLNELVKQSLKNRKKKN